MIKAFKHKQTMVIDRLEYGHIGRDVLGASLVSKNESLRRYNHAMNQLEDFKHIDILWGCLWV